MNPLLNIQDLHVQVDQKEILKGISLALPCGGITALMGPNGSGKSTLASTLVGHPKYKVTAGKMLLEGEDISLLRPDERAKKGIFLSFQYPKSLPGVSIAHFLRSAYKAVHQKDMRVFEFQKKLLEKMKLLDIPRSFMDRPVNEGFSGGEKKKVEILQALILEPKLMIMDETDSGLDVDALKEVAKGVKILVKSGTTVLLITHYNRILKYLVPDRVAVLKDGHMVASGEANLAEEIERTGFEEFKKTSDPFAILD